jgi:Protein of unknown function (DUF3096)
MPAFEAWYPQACSGTPRSYGIRKISAQVEPRKESSVMQIAISPQPVVSLIAGISIFIFPKLLNYIVAIYLIVIGILGLIR